MDTRPDDIGDVHHGAGPCLGARIFRTGAAGAAASSFASDESSRRCDRAERLRGDHRNTRQHAFGNLELQTAAAGCARLPLAYQFADR